MKVVLIFFSNSRGLCFEPDLLDDTILLYPFPAIYLSTINADRFASFSSFYFWKYYHTTKKKNNTGWSKSISPKKKQKRTVEKIEAEELLLKMMSKVISSNPKYWVPPNRVDSTMFMVGVFLLEDLTDTLRPLERMFFYMEIPLTRTLYLFWQRLSTNVEGKSNYMIRMSSL